MYKNIFFKKIEKMLDKFESIGYNNQALRDADVAHPVERHLAKVEVASSSLVTRSKRCEQFRSQRFFSSVRTRTIFAQARRAAARMIL